MLNHYKNGRCLVIKWTSFFLLFIQRADCGVTLAIKKWVLMLKYISNFYTIYKSNSWKLSLVNIVDKGGGNVGQKSRQHYVPKFYLRNFSVKGCISSRKNTPFIEVKQFTNGGKY
jgi:hypothetical protein